MTFLKNLENRIKNNFNIWDFSLLKLVGLVFGLLVGAYFADFIKSNYIIFIVILLLLGIRLIYKLNKK